MGHLGRSEDSSYRKMGAARISKDPVVRLTPLHHSRGEEVSPCDGADKVTVDGVTRQHAIGLGDLLVAATNSPPSQHERITTSSQSLQKARDLHLSLH